MRKSSNLLRFAHVNAEKFLELMKTNQNDVSSITFKEIEYKKKPIHYVLFRKHTRNDFNCSITCIRLY